MDAAKELKRLLGGIEEAKKDMANANGQMKVIRQNLKEVAGTDSIKKAEELIKKWEKEAGVADADLETLMSTLKEEYNW